MNYEFLARKHARPALKAFWANREKHLQEAGVPEEGINEETRARLLGAPYAYLPEQEFNSIEDEATYRNALKREFEDAINPALKDAYDLHLLRNKELVTSTERAFRLGESIGRTVAHQFIYLRSQPEELKATAAQILELKLNEPGRPKIFFKVRPWVEAGFSRALDDYFKKTDNTKTARVIRYDNKYPRTRGACA